jgi:hypothetical protein
MHINLIIPTRYVTDSLQGDLDAFLSLGQFGRDEEFPKDVFTEGMGRLPGRVQFAMDTLHTVFTAAEDKVAAQVLKEFLAKDLERHTEQLEGKDELLESELLSDSERIDLLEQIGTRIEDLKKYTAKLEELL